MTSRRERPPVGASNFTEATILPSARQSTLSSARNSSELDLPTKRTVQLPERFQTRTVNNTALKQTNTLRSTFLDPDRGTVFPPSKTWSQLQRRIKLIESPDVTYDLDDDGYVGQDDYRLAKHLDAQGKGFLSDTSRYRGQRMIAEAFFKRHATGISKFGEAYKDKTVEDNVDSLVNDPHFPLVLRNLRGKERSLMGRASEQIVSCMALEDDSLTKHNFYVDKFDATAWNDFDAIPRSSSTFGLTDHGGSRKRLVFSRKQAVRESNQEKMNYADSLKPHYNTRKSNLITNIAIENS